MQLKKQTNHDMVSHMTKARATIELGDNYSIISANFVFYLLGQIWYLLMIWFDLYNFSYLLFLSLIRL